VPGQAVVSINQSQWTVSLATTYAELTTGLGGIDSLSVGTGMLFILPAAQAVSVDTSGMNFPLDIIFISNNKVIDVARDIQPGYLVTEETPCDSFLEVNAGEAANVEVGDPVNVEPLYTIVGDDIGAILSFAVPLAALGFVCAMAGGMMTGVTGSSSSPKLLSNPKSKSEKVTVKCPICGKEIEVAGYDRVTRSEALRKHIEKEHRLEHHSMWLPLEQRKELEKKYGAVAVRWAEEATRPGDLKGVETAAEYYSKKMREILGLGHLSPDLTEEQITKLRELLGLPADVAEVLKIHQEKGYIPC